jgi:hypothetical protein
MTDHDKYRASLKLSYLVEYDKNIDGKAGLMHPFSAESYPAGKIYKPARAGLLCDSLALSASWARSGQRATLLDPSPTPFYIDDASRASLDGCLAGESRD